MELKDRIKVIQDKRQSLVNQHNQIETQKQEILQEILRLDGELRILTKLIEEA